MECEVCGTSIERPVEAKIEGGAMKVCQRCARYGTVKKSTVPKAQHRAPPTGFKPAPFRRPAKSTLECRDDYSVLIRSAREKKDMTREDLGMAINEKTSVIGRLESGAMVPETKLARKVEKALGITILEVPGEEEISKGPPPSRGMTIGDLIK